MAPPAAAPCCPPPFHTCHTTTGPQTIFEQLVFLDRPPQSPLSLVFISVSAATTPVPVLLECRWSISSVFKTIQFAAIREANRSFFVVKRRNVRSTDITKGITTAEHEKRITINNTNATPPCARGLGVDYRVAEAEGDL